ncbi:Uncharacterised protein [Mycobacteroides abscessus subsp. abscessus]|nr:Uncharacterised protein [Mycobacteroides abscessus subsp. abscessus]
MKTSSAPSWAPASMDSAKPRWLRQMIPTDLGADGVRAYTAAATASARRWRSR